jgi:hypothetical protein
MSPPKPDAFKPEDAEEVGDAIRLLASRSYTKQGFVSPVSSAVRDPPCERSAETTQILASGFFGSDCLGDDVA